MEPVVLHTERLILRAPTVDDVPQIVEYANDPEIVAFTPMPVPYGTTEGLTYVRVHAGEGWASGERCEFLLHPVDDPDVVLGSVSIFGVHDDAGELGYLLAPAARGHGYMLEAASAVLDWAFASAPRGLGLVRVRWRAIATNDASAAVAQRLGFTLEGRTRSSVLHRAQRHDELLAGLLVTDERVPTVWGVPAAAPTPVPAPANPLHETRS